MTDCSNLPWICIDDFNEILYGQENKGGHCQSQALIDGFRVAVPHIDLHDFALGGYTFT